MATTITIPEASQDRKVVEGKEEQVTVYHVNVRGPGTTKTVYKRFHDFREFDEGWKKVYPHLKDTLSHSIPNAIVLFKNSPKVVAERKAKLEAYIQEIAQLHCLQEFLAPFLEVPLSAFGRAEAAISASTAVMALLSEEEQKTMKKGNNDEASRKAHADKEAFMKQHAGLLESLLPGRTVNIAVTREIGGAKSPLGHILLSVWHSRSDATLNVFVHEAIDLPSLDSNGFSDPYVKMFVKPDPEKKSKKKTRIHTRTLNPKFNEGFSWPLPPSEVASKRLDFLIWDHNLHLNHNLIGQVLFACNTLPETKEPKWYPIGKASERETKGTGRTQRVLRNLLGMKKEETEVVAMPVGVTAGAGAGATPGAGGGGFAPTPPAKRGAAGAPVRGGGMTPRATAADDAFAPKRPSGAPPSKRAAAPTTPVTRAPAPTSPAPAPTPTPTAAPAVARRPVPPMVATPPVLKHKCIFDFPGENDTDLAMVVGDIIVVTNSEDADWWEGEIDGRAGLFPVAYTEVLPPPAPVAPTPAPAPRGPPVGRAPPPVAAAPEPPPPMARPLPVPVRAAVTVSAPPPPPSSARVPSAPGRVGGAPPPPVRTMPSSPPTPPTPPLPPTPTRDGAPAPTRTPSRTPPAQGRTAPPPPRR